MTAILSFALAIALNTTIYSLLEALIDPQIDVRKPEQLYSLRFFGDYHHRPPQTAVTKPSGQIIAGGDRRLRNAVRISRMVAPDP